MTCQYAHIWCVIIIKPKTVCTQLYCLCMQGKTVNNAECNTTEYSQVNMIFFVNPSVFYYRNMRPFLLFFMPMPKIVDNDTNLNVNITNSSIRKYTNIHDFSESTDYTSFYKVFPGKKPFTFTFHHRKDGCTSPLA